MSGPRILNVEDYEPTLYARTRILREAGYQVFEARSGEEALQVAARELPEMAILDLNLPDLNGFEVCRRLKEGADTSQILVLHISATMSESDARVRGLTNGADSFLAEPVEPMELIASVQALLRLRAAEADLRESRDEARRLYEEARRANEAKDSFLAVLSHELRTPLNAMLNWVTLLRANQVGPDQVPHALEVIERNTLAQARLIDDLLDVSRMVAGRLSLEARPTDLADVAQHALEAVRPLADAEGQKLRLRGADQVWLMHGDPVRLHQVVVNLLSNAVKFTGRGGFIALTLTRRDGRVALEVEDNGAGIDGAFLPHVFEAFRQADSGIRHHKSGLGLGLAIARHIVEAHGGTLTAESDGAGRGARFVAEFPASSVPVVPETVGVPGRRGTPGVYPDLKGVTVLLVDDERDSLEAMGLLLRSCGASTLEAGSAAAAREAFRTHVPDALVVDVAMPGEDGLTLMRRLCAEADGNEPRALALTGFASASDRDAALEAGFRRHMAKPADPAAIAWAVLDLARDTH